MVSFIEFLGLLLWGFLLGVSICLFVIYYFFPSSHSICFDDAAGFWDPNGYDEETWICVRVEGLSYERALEVCQHEVGHEIFSREKLKRKINISNEDFAEICESNFTKCKEMI